MFTTKWIRAIGVVAFLAMALPCLGQSSASGYDRMDGDFIKPSRREQPNRNFNLTTKEPLNVYSVRRGANPRASSGIKFQNTAGTAAEDDSHESRAAKERTPSVRYQQPSEVKEAEVVLDDEGVAVVEAAEAGEGVETNEAGGVAVPETAAPARQVNVIDVNQLVYCSNRLHEFHLDQNCAMLKNVKPTRMTYADAKEDRYTECTACGGKR